MLRTVLRAVVGADEDFSPGHDGIAVRLRAQIGLPQHPFALLVVQRGHETLEVESGGGCHHIAGHGSAPHRPFDARSAGGVRRLRGRLGIPAARVISVGGAVWSSQVAGLGGIIVIGAGRVAIARLGNLNGLRAGSGIARIVSALGFGEAGTLGRDRIAVGSAGGRLRFPTGRLGGGR